jgi:hypothetical protein
MPRDIKRNSRYSVLPPMAATAVVAILVIQPSASWADWDITPSLSAGYEYDDNPSLVPDSDPFESVNGYLIEGDARISYRSPLSSLSLTPRALLRRYDNQSFLDSNNYFLDADYRYTGQRSRFRLRGNFGDEAVRTAERSNVDFNADDPTQIPADDSGRVVPTGNRQRLGVNPEWSYQVGERSRLRLGAGYINVMYDKSISAFYSDYTESSALAAIEHNLSERSTINFGSYYRKDSFDSPNIDLSGYGASVGFSRALNQRTNLALGIGADSTEDDTGERTTSPIGELSLTRDMETSQLLAVYRRSITGSGRGQIAVRDALSLNFTHDINYKIAVGAGFRIYNSEPLGNNAGNAAKRNYAQLRGLLSWNLTRVFAIEFDYEYTLLDRGDTISNSKSNRVDVWFRYRPIGPET